MSYSHNGVACAAVDAAFPRAPTFGPHRGDATPTRAAGPPDPAAAVVPPGRGRAKTAPGRNEDGGVSRRRDGPGGTGCAGAASCPTPPASRGPDRIVGCAQFRVRLATRRWRGGRIALSARWWASARSAARSTAPPGRPAAPSLACTVSGRRSPPGARTGSPSLMIVNQNLRLPEGQIGQSHDIWTARGCVRRRAVPS